MGERVTPKRALSIGPNAFGEGWLFQRTLGLTDLGCPVPESTGPNIFFWEVWGGGGGGGGCPWERTWFDRFWSGSDCSRRKALEMIDLKGSGPFMNGAQGGKADFRNWISHPEFVPWWWKTVKKKCFHLNSAEGPVTLKKVWEYTKPYYNS